MQRFKQFCIKNNTSRLPSVVHDLAIRGQYDSHWDTKEEEFHNFSK